MKRIYIAHPYASAPEANTSAMLGICRRIALAGDMPLAPALYFPNFLDDTDNTEREIGLILALRLLDICDEVWYYGPSKNSFALAEKVYAVSKNIKVIDQPPA